MMHLVCLLGPLGPHSAGKKFLCDLLEHQFGSYVYVANLGDEIRERRRTDTVFEKRYGQTISRGEYLPGPVVCDIASAVLKKFIAMNELLDKEYRKPVCVLGGFPQTPEQARYACEIGILDNKSLTLIMEGDGVCASLREIEVLVQGSGGRVGHRRLKARRDTNHHTFGEFLGYVWHEIGLALDVKTHPGTSEDSGLSQPLAT